MGPGCRVVTCRWVSWFQLEIQFDTVLVDDLYPTLYDYSQTISNLRIAINPEAQVKSRDFASPFADTRWVFSFPACHRD